jgi:hypothetical protein
MLAELCVRKEIKEEEKKIGRRKQMPMFCAIQSTCLWRGRGRWCDGGVRGRKEPHWE